jgi:hypothetical protein
VGGTWREKKVGNPITLCFWTLPAFYSGVPSGSYSAHTAALKVSSYSHKYIIIGKLLEGTCRRNISGLFSWGDLSVEKKLDQKGLFRPKIFVFSAPSYLQLRGLFFWGDLSEKHIWLVPSFWGDLAGEKSWESNYLVFLDPSSFLFWSSLGEYSALKAALKVSSLSHIYIIIGKYREVLGYPTRLGGTRLPDPYLGGTRLPDPYWGGTAASP